MRRFYENNKHFDGNKTAMITLILLDFLLIDQLVILLFSLLVFSDEGYKSRILFGTNGFSFTDRLLD